MARTATPPINPDFEQRSLWRATMPDLPDRSDRRLPDSVDVVVIGGGYAGLSTARELGRRGVGVAVIEAETLGFGASTRNGGIVHPGYKWGPRQLIRKHGVELGRALYQDTLDGYETIKNLIADEAIECEFREVGYVELAFAQSHVKGLGQVRQSLAEMGEASLVVPREKLDTEIGSDAYYGGLVV